MQCNVLKYLITVNTTECQLDVNFFLFSYVRVLILGFLILGQVVLLLKFERPS